MSSDAWSGCPECRIVKTRELENLRSLIDSSYGNLSLPEFNDLQAKAAEAERVLDSLDDEQETRTLRQDYYFRLDSDGELTISFEAGCRACGYSFEYFKKIDARDPKNAMPKPER